MSEAPDDLAVLFPERSITLSTGEVVEVHEFNMREGLAANAYALPLIADIEALYSDDAVDVAVHLIDEALGTHAGIVMRLVSLATNKSDNWLRDLNDDDGQTLASAMYEVNSDFFLRRVVRLRLGRNFVTARSLPN